MMGKTMIADEIDALRAAALAPAEGGGLVERLRKLRYDNEPQLFQHEIAELEEAASLIRSQAARIAELEEVVADLATDLEAELNARYGVDPVHPAEARRKERDMEPVQRARALLNKDPSHD